MPSRKKAPPGCEGCIDLTGDGLCRYAVRTGHRRGCPPGEGCTVKTVGPRPKPVCTLPPKPQTERPLPFGSTRRAWALEELSQSELACRLYAEGAMDAEIALATGFCITTVAKWRRETGRPANRYRKRRMQHGNQSDDPAGGAG